MALKKIFVAAGGQLLIDIPQENKRLLVQIDEDEVRVTSDKCRHRGGPIHLCYTGEDNVRRCPWHDRKVLSDETSDEVCATYHRQSGVICLISQYPEDVLWPTRVIVPDAPVSRVAEV
jgi:Rieske [2Fe-2S] domain